MNGMILITRFLMLSHTGAIKRRTTSLMDEEEKCKWYIYTHAFYAVTAKCRPNCFLLLVLLLYVLRQLINFTSF